MGRAKASVGLLRVAGAGFLSLIFGFSPVAWCDEQAQLTIRFPDGKNQFRQGEVIAVELHFSTTAPDTYTVSTRSYDRSGRLDIDKLDISPQPRDPLHDYYHGLQMGFLGGGLSGSKTLGGELGEPYLYRMEINEWAAFDHPGRYSLAVTSSRVTRSDPSSRSPVALQLRSNQVEFEIVEADPGWQVRTLAEAIAALDSPAASDKDHRHARSVVRFMDSEASVRELVRRLGDAQDADRWDWKAGLLASRHRLLVATELEAAINAPNIALTYDYLFVLNAVRFLLDHPESLPSYPAEDAVQQQLWRDTSMRRSRLLATMMDAAYERATRAVSMKQDRAKAATLQALIDWPNVTTSRRESRALLAAEFAQVFALLPVGRQEAMLQYEWRRIASPAMIAALRRILDQPKLDAQYLRDASLRRLFQLDSVEGGARILREIRHPHMDLHGSLVSSATLGLLPERQRPDLEKLLLSRVEEGAETQGRDALLIARYASPAAVSRVKAVLSTRPSSCDVNDGLIGYLARVDSPFAIQAIRQYKGYCLLDGPIRELHRHGRWPELEPLFLALLESDDEEHVRRAAQVLQRFGSAQAEAALWRRLERLHGLWAERDDELGYGSKASKEGQGAWQVQFALIQALSTGQGWLLDAEKRPRLERLAVGEHARQHVASLNYAEPVSLSVSIGDGHFYANLAQYSMTDPESLRTKLAQFPAGTRLNVHVSGEEEEELDARIEELKSFALAQGIQIVEVQKNVIE